MLLGAIHELHTQEFLRGGGYKMLIWKKRARKQLYLLKNKLFHLNIMKGYLFYHKIFNLVNIKSLSGDIT